MVIRKVIKCDICNQDMTYEYKRYNFKEPKIRYKFFDSSSWKGMDICSACYRNFIAWLEKVNKKEGEQNG